MVLRLPDTPLDRADEQIEIPNNAMGKRIRNGVGSSHSKHIIAKSDD